MQACVRVSVSVIFKFKFVCVHEHTNVCAYMCMGTRGQHFFMTLHFFIWNWFSVRIWRIHIGLDWLANRLQGYPFSASLVLGSYCEALCLGPGQRCGGLTSGIFTLEQQAFYPSSVPKLFLKISVHLNCYQDPNLVVLQEFHICQNISYRWNL